MGNVTPYPGALGATYSPPAPLTTDCDTSNFDCGKLPLNDWLKYRALKSQGKSARTFVVTDRRKAVVGYYCLSTGGVARADVPSKLRRNMPEAIPVIIIGRLAVDQRHQGQGIGRGLLKDAFLRTVSASDLVGVRAVLVHAIDADALPFYSRYGFRQFPEGTLTLFVSMEDVIASL